MTISIQYYHHQFKDFQFLFKDLTKFYKEFTGHNEMPTHIKKFSDIRLRDYSKTPICYKPKNTVNKVYEGSYKDELFECRQM